MYMNCKQLQYILLTYIWICRTPKYNDIAIISVKCWWRMYNGLVYKCWCNSRIEMSNSVSEILTPASLKKPSSIWPQPVLCLPRDRWVRFLPTCTFVFVTTTYGIFSAKEVKCAQCAAWVIWRSRGNWIKNCTIAYASHSTVLYLYWGTTSINSNYIYAFTHTYARVYILKPGTH